MRSMSVSHQPCDTHAHGSPPHDSPMTFLCRQSHGTAMVAPPWQYYHMAVPAPIAVPRQSHGTHDSAMNVRERP